MEHISRSYSPDLKNVILYLLSKPSAHKTIDEVVRMLGQRLLNEFDAIQK
jgi:PAB-dependent poly(A)-specific ribonuclease subunit 3